MKIGMFDSLVLSRFNTGRGFEYFTAVCTTPLCRFEQCCPDYPIENRRMESKISATRNGQPVSDSFSGLQAE
jgi:hypothetical protein